MHTWRSTTSLVEELAASTDPAALMARIAEATCTFMPKADGASVCLRDHNDCFVVVSTHGRMQPALGRVVPVSRTFNARALQTGVTQFVGDAEHDERLTQKVRMVAARLGVRSNLAIPLFRGRHAIGVLSLVSAKLDAFDDDDIAAITALSEFIATLITANTELAALVRGLIDDQPNSSEDRSAAHFLASIIAPEVAARDRLRMEIGALAAPGRLRAVFQPVVDLTDGQVHAFEGLTRFPDHHRHGPEHWFRLAHRVGLGVDLEVTALATVLDAATTIPDRYHVGVNLSPIAALDPTAQTMLLGADRPVGLELTEHEPAPEALNTALEPLRRAGVLLTVDAAGAGFAGLTQILRLRPDTLKLDRELTAGIETDPARRALTTALVQFAAELGAVTVAEGIETQDQCEVLRELGIQYGQGYWLGPPRPAPELFPPTGR